MTETYVCYQWAKPFRPFTTLRVKLLEKDARDCLIDLIIRLFDMSLELTTLI